MQDRFEGSAVWPPSRQGLYDPANEHDACGLGFIAHIKGQKRHAIITQALSILRNLSHRGATGADPLQGDGAGILIQLPDRVPAQGVRRAGPHAAGGRPVRRRHGVPAEGAGVADGVRAGDRARGRERRPDPARLARRADGQQRPLRAHQGRRAGHPAGLHRARVERRWTRTRSSASSTSSARSPATRSRRCSFATARSSTCRRCRRARSSTRGCCSRTRSASTSSTCSDESMVSALAMVHQRFSTNTFPTWDLAHPFRLVCHNGEINTLRGNVNWIRARQQGIASTVLGDDLDKIWPLIYDGQSDSASFDNALELLVMGGYSLAHAMMLMIPEAWAGNPLMDEDRRAFYEYHAALMEPWDGPAAMAFTDGRQIGATLDRNGLRPARFIVTDDDYIVMASEVGVLDIPERKIVTKWRLQPGKMLLVDTEQGRIIDDDELKRTLATAKPYRALDRALADRARRPAGPGAAAADRGAAARSPAGVRLHAGRPQDHPRADGARRRGGDRLDGQRRRAAGAVAAAEGALQLLQAALRAGDESADRSDPRRARDVARHVHRAAAEPARRRRSGGRRGSADAPRGAAADPHQRRDGEDPPRRALHRRRVQDVRARHLLSGRVGRERHGGGARVALRRPPRTRSTSATTS